MDFREFVESNDQLNSLLNEFNNTAMVPYNPQAQPKQKLWSAKKPEILQMWKTFRPDTAIVISPIADDVANPSHSTYGEDGLRITGSWQFITSILSRLKELSYYENPQTKLRLVLRAVDKSKSRTDRQSYVFYLNLEKRAKGKAGRPIKT